MEESIMVALTSAKFDLEVNTKYCYKLFTRVYHIYMDEEDPCV